MVKSDRSPGLIMCIVFATQLPVLLFADRSPNEGAQSAICCRRLVSPDNHRATQAGPSALSKNKTRPEFESDHRTANPTRTDSSLHLLESFSRARRDRATQAVARLLFSLCWKDA